MSSCNVEWVSMEISPTTKGCCSDKTSCNGGVVNLGLSGLFSGTWSGKTSCNGPTALLTRLRA
jgi:hypothetical protein